VKLSEGRRHPARGEAFRRTPKDAEGRRRTPKDAEGRRRTPFLREEAEGRPSFGRKPKDVLFSKQVASFGNLWRFLRKAARGEASRRTRFFQNKFRKPKDALFSKQVHQAARGEAFRRTFRNKFIKPPEVKLSEGRRASFRKPPEVKLPEGRSEKSCFLREPLALSEGSELVPSERECR